MRLIGLALLLSAIWTVQAVAQNSSPPAYGTGQNSTSTNPSSPPQTEFSGHVDEMQSELNQMRSLLSQMQMNLPFVASTENPLKHQFELEIEMWGLLVDQLQRNLDAMRSAPRAQKPASSGQSLAQPGGIAADSRYHPLFDNEFIHSSSLILPSRAQAPVYQNIHDVIWIAITDAWLSFTNREKQMVSAELRAGDVRVFPRNRIVSVTNSGQTPLQAVIVELRKTGLVTTGCGCGTAVEASICGCQGARHLPGLWALNLGHITLAGTTLKPGEAFKNLAHRGNMLLVAISPADLGDEANPNEKLQLTPGAVVWIPAGLHRLKDLGAAPARFVTVEF